VGLNRRAKTNAAVRLGQECPLFMVAAVPTPPSSAYFAFTAASFVENKRSLKSVSFPLAGFSLRLGTSEQY